MRSSLFAIRNVIAVFVSVSLFCFSSTASSAAQDQTSSRYDENTFQIGDAVQDAIAAWTYRTGLPVTQDAQILIGRDFSRSLQSLAVDLHREKASPEQEKQLSMALVAHYLFDLRDQRLVGKVVGRTGLHMDWAHPSEEVAPIKLEDVQRTTPDRFLDEMSTILGGKVGYLNIGSNPDSAAIAIDGEIKGLTCRTFVLSPGEHRIAVSRAGTRINCSAKVTVQPFATETFMCPARSKCPSTRKK